jgi:hypothetical protein
MADQLLFQGDVFSLKFPSGNSYDGMHADGNMLRGFFYLKNVSLCRPESADRDLPLNLPGIGPI